MAEIAPSSDAERRAHRNDQHSSLPRSSVRSINPDRASVPNESTIPTFLEQPARAELARLIGLVASAAKGVEQAQQPLDRLANIAGRAKVREAEELHAELARLREQDSVAVTSWLDGGATGPRPIPSEETLAAERLYAEVSQAANQARAALPTAEQSLTEALERLRAVTAQRDRAVFEASVEACESALAELDRANAAACTIESRLRSVVGTLRQFGWSAQEGSPALSAATRIEKRISLARRKAVVRVDTESGHRLLGALKTDPSATL